MTAVVGEAGAGETTAVRGGALDAAMLRRICLEAGADDAGFVELERPALTQERPYILEAFAATRTLVSYVIGMNRENVRSPARSLANTEFHETNDAVEAVARRVLRSLNGIGVRGLYPPAGFPMEMNRFPGRIWTVAHKPVAEEAGLGRMGIHRSVIHPRLGSFVLLGTLLIDHAVTAYDQPLENNPCLTCKLCVAACPVGAIGADGAFNFNACMTHNYREFLSGFTSFMEDVADSRDRFDYRERVSDSESASWWQSLAFGPNYKAAYCIAVCPAGSEVIGPYSADKAGHKRDVMRPLTDKPEPIYIVPGSDAEDHLRKRFPHKQPRPVRNPIRPVSVASFLRGLLLNFNRWKAKGLDARYHFVFTGSEAAEATVVISRQTITVTDALSGTPDLVVRADAATWIAFLRGERSLLRALLTRKIRLKGSPRLLQAFSRCFPR